MREIYEDLDKLQSQYLSTFNESLESSYDEYINNCIKNKIPASSIMSEDEFDAIQSGDWENEDTTYLEEDDEGYLEPKSKMTEEEAMEWFKSDDTFHQLFHKFMERNKYHEKEINGKQFWCKGKNS